MPEFLRLAVPGQALTLLLEALPAARPEAETVPVAQALGRILAEAVVAGEPLPAFPRSTVDGYAVHARDTFGASEALPGYLDLQGEVPMGAAPGFALAPGACALIHTGGMLPDGADAVVMLEHAQVLSGSVEIGRAVAEGENLILVGEDVSEGEAVLSAGARLGPASLGGCMALGQTEVRVARKPRVEILSTGDEVVAAEARPGPGQVRDVNSHSLAALVRQSGGEAVLHGIVPDDPGRLTQACREALGSADLLLITAGSSASARDHTAQVINRLGSPGVLVHGVNLRPGKPTILAVCDGKPVIGLPGNPVSALVVGRLFVTPVIQRLLGERAAPAAAQPATLAVNLPSQAGREDWVAVRLVPDPHAAGTFIAEPVFGKSNLIFSLAHADGLVRIPPEVTGLPAGEPVSVFLL